VPAANEAVITDQVVAASTSPDKSVPTKPNKKRLALTVVVLGALVTGVGIGGAALWRRGATTPVISNAAANVERTLSYWITVQKYRDGKAFENPFRLRDDINFEKDYRIRLNITSSQSGRLYLLNEGPPGSDQTRTFNVMFPSDTANHNSAVLIENQQIQIPQQSWFQFDGQQGTEKIWLVWAEQEVPELEAVKGFANSKDRGVISSPKLQMAVSEFLKTHSSSIASVERDEDKKETIVKANREILVHVIKLEHH